MNEDYKGDWLLKNEPIKKKGNFVNLTFIMHGSCQPMINLIVREITSRFAMKISKITQLRETVVQCLNT